MAILEGFLLLDKPVGMSSFDCIENNLKVLAPRGTKIGHTGTLDAFASGLLIIAFGRRATALIEQFMVLDKKYRAHALWGSQTDTLERTGQIIATSDAPLNESKMLQAIASFGDGYRQAPPLFSALKHNGRRLSDLVRRYGAKQSDIQALTAHKMRPISIYDLQLQSIDVSTFTITAHVSHGTYIRSLVADLAERAGGCATTQQLRRESIGPFHVDEAISLLAIKDFAQLQQLIIAPEVLHGRLRAFHLKTNQEAQVQKLHAYRMRKQMLIV